VCLSPTFFFCVSTVVRLVVEVYLGLRCLTPPLVTIKTTVTILGIKTFFLHEK
jgi:hypothetical protein